MNFLHFEVYEWKPKIVARWFVIVMSTVFFFWFLNQNFAFFGTHKLSITSFSDLPPSVQYIGAGEIGVVSTPEGQRTRPYKDRVDFAVTLPRGFETMTMQAEFSADPYATMVLSAKVPVNTPGQSAAFRLPAAFPAEWRSLPLGTGNLFVKNYPEIQGVASFWDSLEKLKNMYSIGDSMLSFIPPELYNTKENVSAVEVPGAYRGTFTVSAYFDGKPQQITFDSKIAYASEGDMSLQATVLYHGKTVVTKNVPEVEGITQKNVLSIPQGEPGFYSLHFIQRSEATVVSNIQLQADAVVLSGDLFIDRLAAPITLYTQCPGLTVQAVHALGAQNPMQVNGQDVKIAKVKEVQKVNLKAGVNSLRFPRGDVSLKNPCSLTLQPDNALYAAYKKITQRISIAPQLSAAVLEDADFLFDPLPQAEVTNAKQGTYSVEKTFDLHTLYAKGKTFTLSLEVPGLTSRPEGYLHLQRITFTAKRPPFSLSDIPKAFRALF